MLKIGLKQGVWLVTFVQPGEKIVGTEHGVYRVAGILICPPDQRWPATILDKLSATPDAGPTKFRRTPDAEVISVAQRTSSQQLSLRRRPQDQRTFTLAT